MTTASATKVGKVIQVIGPVVDIEFEGGHLPAIYNAIRITGTVAGEKVDIVCEVQQHLGESRVRTVAMKPTDGLQRGMDSRDRGALPASQFVDVHFSSFVKDPIATVAQLYDALGRAFTSDVESRMRAFLEAHPGDGGGSGKRYRFSDTGLEADSLRAKAKAYQERYDVASEVLT